MCEHFSGFFFSFVSLFFLLTTPAVLFHAYDSKSQGFIQEEDIRALDIFPGESVLPADFAKYCDEVGGLGRCLFV